MVTRLVIAIGAVGLAGCDRLFGVDLPADAAPDTIIADALLLPTDGGIGPDDCWNAPLLGDEDNDLELDGCDNCPADPNVDQADLDRDGVGDVCDPHPEYAIDVIRYFSPLAIDDPSWSFRTAGWDFESGALRQESTTEATTFAIAPLATVRWPTIQIQAWDTRYKDGGMQASAFASGVYALTGSSTDLRPAGVVCEIAYLTGRDEVQLYRWDGMQTDERAGAAFPSSPVPGTPTRIVLSTRPIENAAVAAPRCTASRGAATSTAVALDMLDAMPIEARAAVWTLDALANFDHVVVYGLR